jgi:hypothetical protein
VGPCLAPLCYGRHTDGLPQRPNTSTPGRLLFGPVLVPIYTWPWKIVGVGNPFAVNSLRVRVREFQKREL